MHLPVLKNEVLKILDPRPGKTYIDATVGEGGHLMAIIAQAKERGRFLGIDLEERNIKLLEKNINERGLKDRVFLEKANYADLKKIVLKCGINKADGILFDFGVSSWQINESQRGISYQGEEVLDMRLNKDAPLRTAKDIINNESEKEIGRILIEFGEERYHKQIAANIILARSRRPIITTSELVDIVKRSLPRAAKKNKSIHPATRTFQALRIAVNNELAVIEKTLPAAWDLLNQRGVLVAISFHSLEDRIVKNFMKNMEEQGGKILSKKPIAPSKEEILSNRRSRSAKLRAIIKT